MIDTMKAWLLMGVLTVILVLIGSLVGGSSGATFAFLFALAMNFFAYWFSDSIALTMSGARPLPYNEAPGLHETVRRLAARANIPMPRLYLIQHRQPNAFATGRDPSHAAVAVTDGLLGLLDQDEIEGVLSHELSHIRNRDILVATLAATFAGAITMLANMGRWAMFFGGYGGNRDGEGNNWGGAIATMLMLVLAPIAALLVQLAISRTREYGADATGARIAGSPHGLANALEKLDRAARSVPMEVNPAASHLFIVNPLRGEGLVALFSTHPPIQERVRRLRAMRI